MSGRDKLWTWFGLSRAIWLTLPRVMMHEMPDEWQNKMAELLDEWDKTWKSPPDLNTNVSMKNEQGKFIKNPEWLQYRHARQGALDEFKTKIK